MISRRKFLKSFALIASCLPLQIKYTFAITKNNKTERILNLYNIHTGEKLNIIYYHSGIYDHDAIDKINYLLRCHYTDEIKPVNLKVINLLCNIKDRVGREKEVYIISGYRSSLYNEYLKNIGRNVAKNSLHLYGLAIDFAIPGIYNNNLFQIAKSFHAGGVGKYPEFIHIDIGPVRYWQANTNK